MMSGKIINFRSLIKSSPGYAMYDICTESSSYFLRRSPTMTPKLTPVKVMTSNMFLFNHAMNRSMDTFFISGFILNFPGSVKLIQVKIQHESTLQIILGNCSFGKGSVSNKFLFLFDVLSQYTWQYFIIRFHPHTTWLLNSWLSR